MLARFVCPGIPIIGVTMSVTRAVTTELKAAQITNATAKSIAFPFVIKFLNS